MKRIFTLSVMVVASALLFPSCGTHLTVVKRQHSNGYHVHMSSDKKGNSNQTVLAEKKVQIEENEEVAVMPALRPTELEATSTPELQASAATTSTQTSETVENANVVSENATNAARPVEKSSVGIVKNSVKKQVTKIKQTVAKDSKVKKMMNQQAADGLSLFWIVILILILLGVLGLIGGLGNIIYIAFVAALICLILWLLGVI